MQITSQSSEIFVSFHEFFLFRKNRSHLEVGARTMHLIRGQLKHWLPSKITALNYSVTHRIRHSCSYCTTNGWLEDQKQQYFYNGIRASEKNAGPSAFQLQVSMLKSDKIWYAHLVVKCVSLRTFWTSLVVPHEGPFMQKCYSQRCASKTAKETLMQCDVRCNSIHKNIK